jgi:Protein of unknown function (DUF3237)
MTGASSPASQRTTVPVEYLFTFTAHLLPPQVIEAGPQGTRVIIGVTGGTFTGPKLRGVIVPPAGEWATVRPDGSGKGDVRLTLQTEDGALILMTYSGIGRPQPDGSHTVRTAPLFETGDARYAWLNTVQAIGHGTAVGGAEGFESVTYDIYALQ